jgi:hypothetical protein
MMIFMESPSQLLSPASAEKNPPAYASGFWSQWNGLRKELAYRNGSMSADQRSGD